jgi:hypothetical protein
MIEKQIALKITNFQDGLDSHSVGWDIEKRLFDDKQIQILHSAAITGESIRFSVEGSARSGWSFEAKVTEKKNLFQLEVQGEQKHFDCSKSEKLAKEAAELKPYSFITIGNKSAVVSHMHDDGTFQIVYEQSPGKHIAEDAKFDGEKYVFCIDGPCGSYADNNSHYAPFVSALKRRYR